MFRPLGFWSRNHGIDFKTACISQVRGIIGGSLLPAPSGLYSPISHTSPPIATICRVTASLVLSTSRLWRYTSASKRYTRCAAGRGAADAGAGRVRRAREFETSVKLGGL